MNVFPIDLATGSAGIRAVVLGATTILLFLHLVIHITEDFRKSEELDIEDNGIVTTVKLTRHKKDIHVLQFMKPLILKERFFSLAVRKLVKYGRFLCIFGSSLEYQTVYYMFL